MIAVQARRLAGWLRCHPSSARASRAATLARTASPTRATRAETSAGGSGAGRALIEATAELARAAGAEKLYWHTRTGNATARALYDQVASHVGDIVYERDLG